MQAAAGRISRRTAPRRRQTSVLYRLLSHRSHVWYAQVFNYSLMVSLAQDIPAG